MTRRRGSGEDSVYRDGDRWRGAVSLGYDEHGNRVRNACALHCGSVPSWFLE